MNVFDFFFNETKSLDKYFILNEGNKVSYQELYSNSLKVARFINEIVGENKNIILISPNSSFFICVYLGILKSGNICVPLNFNIEQSNLSSIISLTECDLVFTSKQTLRRLNFEDVKNIHDEDSFSRIIERKYRDSFNNNFDSDRLAEIIFTSGSTGEPKGVMISHKNIMANTNSIIEYLHLVSEDIICVVLPFYYCYGLSLLHTHLKVGGSIVLNNNFVFLGTVLKDLQKYKCTGFAGVPSHFQMLLTKSTSFKTTEFPFLRYVTQAGGSLPNRFIEDFVDFFPNINFYVMYGQTEATARLSYLNPLEVKNKIGSIGKAIPNVSLKIVDENGKEVSFEEEGELIAFGENIMQGYFKDSKLTNTILKDNWLYTGDLAKKDRDGNIFITARKKEIIKIGGNRVSPREIEEIICSVDGVVDATVIGIDDDLLGESVKAMVVLENILKKNEIEKLIRENCKENLALYKMPSVFEFKSMLDLKATGKKNSLK